jgi:Skp family chaperone for outer membrane proteins
MTPSRRDFLAGGLAMTGRAGVAEDQAPPSLKLGSVNLRACYDKTRYARMAEMAEDLTKLRSELHRELEELQKKIQVLTGLMEDAKGSPDLYVEKGRQRGHAEYDLKLLQEVAKRKLAAREAEVEVRIYGDVRRVVASLAREGGFDLILRADSPEIDSSPLMASRDVLFSRETLDLTPRVLERLNADWAKAWTCGICKRKSVDEKCADCGAKRP